MTIVHHLTAMVALLALASPGLPALAEESVSPAPPSTAVPLEGTASALPAPTAPVEESTDESLPSEAATASAPPADTGAEGDLPESVAETAAAEVVRAEAPQARASATTLSVRSSVTGAYLQAGVGEYVFEGGSLPGEVTIWWRNLANTDTSWKALLQVETDSAGAFSATDPIGPWVASVDWQATSSTDTSLPPSAVVTTVIHPATTLTVSSSSDGSLFRAGTGEYVFEGSAPPGAVQVQWANLARDTLTWGNSVSTTADAEGAFIATAPIGPWEARFAWRVISPDLPGTLPSQTVYTTIEPGVTLSVWSTTTGSMAASCSTSSQPFIRCTVTYDSGIDDSAEVSPVCTP